MAPAQKICLSLLIKLTKQRKMLQESMKKYLKNEKIKRSLVNYIPPDKEIVKYNDNKPIL